MGSNSALLEATDIKPHSTSNLQRIKTRTLHLHKSHAHLVRILKFRRECNNPSAKLKRVRAYASTLTCYTNVLASSKESGEGIPVPVFEKLCLRRTTTLESAGGQ
eukprot:1732106-Pleurochrysis_carterae.AAC.1